MPNILKFLSRLTLLYLIATPGIHCKQTEGKGSLVERTAYQAVGKTRPPKAHTKGGSTENTAKEGTQDKSAYVKTEEAILTPRFTLPPINGHMAFNATRLTFIYSPIDGRIVEIKAKLGDKVSKNEHMVVIESVELGLAQAEFISGRAELALSEQAYERIKNLYEYGAVAKKQLQEALNDLTAKKSKFEAARTKLITLGMDENEVAALTVPDAKVTAKVDIETPISGTVVEQKTQMGMYIKPNDLLYTVADLSTLWALGNVFEKDLLFLKLGKNVAIETISYPGETFPGKVTYISDVIDPTTRTINIRCEVDNALRKLKPEMFVKINVLPDETDMVVTISNKALLTEGDKRIVIVEKSPGQYAKKAVEVGSEREAIVQISSGLSPGERVVTEGNVFLMAELAISK